MIDLSGPFVLNPRVAIDPVTAFPAHLREKMGGGGDEFILSEIGSRTVSRRITADAASLLRRFARQQTIPEAIASECLDRDADEILARSCTFLAPLIAEGLLIRPGAGHVGNRVSRQPGEQVDGWTLDAVLKDRLDTQVYRASREGAHVAIKLLSSAAHPALKAALRHEAQVLQALQHSGFPCAPRFLNSGEVDGQPTLVMQWRPGRTLFEVSQDRSIDLQARFQFARQLVRAYERLHSLGYAHGDVHPENVLLADDCVTLLDFGSSMTPQGTIEPRMGMLGEYEPEAAEAILRGSSPPAASQAGDQHGLAALVFLLMTGARPLQQSLDAPAMLRRIAGDPPRNWSQFGIHWPALEAIVARGLAKDPRGRYQTVAAFAQELEAVEECPSAARPPRMLEAEPHEAEDWMFETFGLGSPGCQRDIPGDLFHGKAGVAMAFLRLATATESPQALATASTWAERAAASVDAQGRLTGALPTASATSPFHGGLGVLALQALIFNRMGQPEIARAGCNRVLELAERTVGLTESRFRLDATNGPASHLLCLCALEPLLAGDEALRARARRVAQALAAELQQAMGRPESWRGLDGRRYLGYAHGTAGALHAILLASEMFSIPTQWVAPHLDELAAMARGQDGQCHWPVHAEAPGSPPWAGWCHGSAGHLLLWVAAERSFPGRHAGMATAIGEHVWASRQACGPTLCCGQAGMALALAVLGMASGNHDWLTRAKELARLANDGSSSLMESSLFQGRLGVRLAGLMVDWIVSPQDAHSMGRAKGPVPELQVLFG